MSSPPIAKTGCSAGFTLAEMAIVMVVVMILLGGMVATLTGQVDARNQAQTEQTLTDIREALLGFAASQKRLPCPAYTDGNESRPGGVCDHHFDGFVPGATLGIGPADAQGFVLDGWNQRIRYAVTNVGTFTTTIAITTPTQYLSVCSSASGIISGPACNTTTKLTDNAVAVIFSLGRHGAGSGNDEAANRNGDSVFVSAPPANQGTGSAGGEFDDIVTWISPYILYSRMISAGQLP